LSFKSDRLWQNLAPDVHRGSIMDAAYGSGDFPSILVMGEDGNRIWWLLSYAPALGMVVYLLSWLLVGETVRYTGYQVCDVNPRDLFSLHLAYISNGM
jgi:hypothetical protein